MKKILSIILVICMMMTIAPVGVFAQTDAVISNAVITFSGVDVTFETNSTSVKEVTFDNGSYTKDHIYVNGTKHGDVKTYSQHSNDMYTKIVDVSTTSTQNLAIQLYRNDLNLGEKKDLMTNLLFIEDQSEPEYIVFSYDSKSNSTFDRLDFRFSYTNGTVENQDNAGLRLMLKGNSIGTEHISTKGLAVDEFGCDNEITLEANQFLGDWHKYTYVIDTVAKNAYIFVDDNYLMSIAILPNGNKSNHSNSDYQIMGMEYLNFTQLRGATSWLDDTKVRETLFDNFSYRTMTATQLNGVIENDIVVPSTLVAGTDKLPVASASYEMPIAWTVNNPAVVIAEDGSLSLDGASRANNVTFTATVLGKTKTFVATVTSGSSDSDEPGQTAAIKFEANSTVVKSLDFETGFGEIMMDGSSQYGPEGNKFKAYKRDGDRGYTAVVDIDDTDAVNLGLKLYKDKINSSLKSETVSNLWFVESLTESPYIVVSYKGKTNNNKERVHFRFYYEDLVDGEIVPDGSNAGAVKDSDSDPGLPMIFEHNNVKREELSTGKLADLNTGCVNSMSVNNERFVGDWHTYTYVIDAIAKKAYLYIDGEYLMDMAIVRARNANNYAGDANKYISGIEYIQIKPDKDGNSIRKTDDSNIIESYYDDFTVNKMTAAEYMQVMDSDSVSVPSTISATEYKLPVVTSSYKMPVTWADDNESVVIAGDTITLIDTNKVENVTLTADILGIQKTFKVTIESTASEDDDDNEDDENSESLINNSSIPADKMDFDDGNYTNGHIYVNGQQHGALKTYNNHTEHFYTSIEDVDETEEGTDLALRLYRNDDFVTDKQGEMAHTLFLDNSKIVALNSPYIVASYRSKTNSTFERIHFRFAYNNGNKETQEKTGLSVVFNADSISSEYVGKGVLTQGEYGCDNIINFKPNKYLNEWHTYTYIIDAEAKNAYLFIDDSYVMSMAIVPNANEADHDNTGLEIAGINYVQIFQPKGAGSYYGDTKERITYYDFLEVRQMTANQFETMISNDIKLSSTHLTTVDVLPATDTLKFPISWTADNDAVEINADGEITLNGVESVEDVTLTATAKGFTKQFVVSIEKSTATTSLTVTKDADADSCTVQYVVIPKDLAKEPIMYVAFYNNENSLVSVTVIDENILGEDEFTVEIPEGSEKCQVMLWTFDLKPICDADFCEY